MLTKLCSDGLLNNLIGGGDHSLFVGQGDQLHNNSHMMCFFVASNCNK